MRTFVTSGAVLAMVVSSGIAQADWAVEGKGRVVYAEADKTTFKGLEHVTVRLMDSDVTFDDEIAVGLSSTKGNIDLKGRAGDPFDGQPDPYLQFMTYENGRVDTRDLLGFSYRYDTTEIEDTHDLQNFGTWHFEFETAILFARANTAYDFYTSTIGGKIPLHGGTAGVIYPAIIDAGVPYTTEESIHWPGDYTNWDATYHEFGHRIRHAADGGFGHFLIDVARFDYLQHHNSSSHTNDGFAFNEGWAEYHSTLLDPVQKKRYQTFSAEGGEATEGNVAHQLLMLSEACGGFKTMWGTLRGAGENAIHSYAEFYSRFLKEHSACASKVNGAVPANAVASRSANAATLTAGAIAVPSQSAAVTRMLDQIDARSAAMSKNAVRPGETKLAKESPVVAASMGRIQAKRQAITASWDTNARKVYRAQVSGLKPVTTKSLSDGSHAKEVEAARAAFVTQVATPRLAEVKDLRALITRERAAASNAKHQTYLDKLNTKYGRLEAELTRALKDPTKIDTAIEDAILPRSFHGKATRVTAAVP